MERHRSNIELSSEERRVLAEVLESAYRGLKAEIGRTEGFEFKRELQARRDTIKAVIEKVIGGPLQD